MGQNQVALAMCILDTTRYPRFANVAQITRLEIKNRWSIARPAIEFMVENRGFEPLTSWLPAMRSPS